MNQYLAHYAGDVKTFKWLLSDFRLFESVMNTNVAIKNLNKRMFRKLEVTHEV